MKWRRSVVSTRSHSTAGMNCGRVYPAERFVTDFARLISDIDWLLVDMRGATGEKNGGLKAIGRPRKFSLNEAISPLRDQAALLVRSLGRHEVSDDGNAVPNLEHGPALAQLIGGLCRAETLTSMGGLVGNYCNKAFGSPA